MHNYARLMVLNYENVQNFIMAKKKQRKKIICTIIKWEFMIKISNFKVKRGFKPISVYKWLF